MGHDIRPNTLSTIIWNKLMKINFIMVLIFSNFIFNFFKTRASSIRPEILAWKCALDPNVGKMIFKKIFQNKQWFNFWTSFWSVSQSVVKSHESCTISPKFADGIPTQLQKTKLCRSNASSKCSVCFAPCSFIVSLIFFSFSRKFSSFDETIALPARGLLPWAGRSVEEFKLMIVLGGLGVTCGDVKETAAEEGLSSPPWIQMSGKNDF